MTAATRRRRDLARIHCLAKELGLDDDEYRDVIWTVARVRSARDLDGHGRQSVINHLASRRQQQPGRAERRPRPGADRDGLARKIQAQQADLGVGDHYVDAIARRVCGVDRWTWCDPEQLRKLVAALTYAQRRKGKGE